MCSKKIFISINNTEYKERVNHLREKIFKKNIFSTGYSILCSKGRKGMANSKEENQIRKSS